MTRIAGDDRYATAAAIASKIDSDSSWCGASAASAVLINGATDMLSYGVAVQAVAFRLHLPVLMTESDMLPDVTAEFISDNDIEHVQIIGGTQAVSAEVVSALTTLGVDTVDRVGGDSAAEVSVELAKMANNGCGDALGLVSSDRVALVRGNPDGVVGAPVLASSPAGGYLVTPLIVEGGLPASVRDYLAATPKAIGGNNLNLGVVAVGGMAAVSGETMAAALEAAASSGALTVSIGASTGTNGDGTVNADDPVRPYAGTVSGNTDSAAGPVVTLYFNDGVMPDVAKLQDVVEVNGVPAVVRGAVTSTTGGPCDKRRIDVTLGQRLAAGDTISVASSSHKFGVDEDQRTVGSASTTVTAMAPDSARPTAAVLGISDAFTDGSAAAWESFTVTFSDAGGFGAMEANGVAADAFMFAKAAGAVGGATATPTHAAVTEGDKSFTVTVPIGRDLAAGDRLIVKPGAAKDAAGNSNPGTSRSAFKAQASPRITSVQMSALKHSVNAKWTVPSELVGGATGDHVISIEANDDGDAAGNGWSMVFDRASTYSAAKPLDIDVRVDTEGQRVTVRFDNGPATANLGDLLAALKANADFDARFAAGFANCATGKATTQLGLNAVRDHVEAADGAGRTQFAIEVRFGAYVQTVTSEELLKDLLAATALRAKTANDTSGIRAPIAGGSGTPAGGGLSVFDDLSAGSPSLTANVAGPRMSVRYDFETALVKNLPMARDLVETQAGIADAPAITGPPAFPAIASVAAVATGYAADALATGATGAADARDKVDEDKNAGGQQRIAVTTSVKTP